MANQLYHLNNIEKIKGLDLSRLSLKSVSSRTNFLVSPLPPSSPNNSSKFNLIKTTVNSPKNQKDDNKKRMRTNSMSIKPHPSTPKNFQPIGSPNLGNTTGAFHPEIRPKKLLLHSIKFFEKDMDHLDSASSRYTLETEDGKIRRRSTAISSFRTNEKKLPQFIIMNTEEPLIKYRSESSPSRGKGKIPCFSAKGGLHIDITGGTHESGTPKAESIRSPILDKNEKLIKDILLFSPQMGRKSIKNPKDVKRISGVKIFQPLINFDPQFTLREERVNTLHEDPFLSTRRMPELSPYSEYTLSDKQQLLKTEAIKKKNLNIKVDLQSLKMYQDTLISLRERFDVRPPLVTFSQQTPSKQCTNSVRESVNLIHELCKDFNISTKKNQKH